MTSININLRLITQSLIFIMLFGTILIGYVVTIYGDLELLLLLIVFVLSILYVADKKESYNINTYSYFYLFFLSYLISILK